MTRFYLFSQIVILLAFTLLTATSCTNTQDREADKVLNAADAVMFSHPDSALQILTDLDTTGLSDSRIARYALLMTKASDKNYLPLTNDSLILKAVNHYSGRGDSLETQALYYYGETLCHLNKKDDALLYLHLANDAANEINDNFYTALTYRTLSEEYKHLFIFNKALEYGLKAKEYFILNGSIIHAQWMDDIIMDLYIDNGNPTKALDYSEQIDSIFLNSNDNFKHSIIRTRANAHIQLDQYTDVIKAYEYLINDNYKMRAHDWCKLSDAYLHNSDFVLSRQYMDSASYYSHTTEDSLYIKKLNSLLLINEGNYRKAAKEAYEWGCDMMESNAQRLAFPKTLQLTDYYHLISEIKKKESQTAQERSIWIGIVSFLLIIISLSSILKLRKKIKARNLTITTLAQESKELFDDLSKYKQLGLKHDTAIKELLYEKFKALDKICSQWFAVGSNIINEDNLPKGIKCLLDYFTYETEKSNLDSLIDIYSNGWVESLIEKIPNLRSTHIRLSRYLLVGLSNESIAVLMKKRTSNAVRQEKFRLKKVILDSGIEDVDVILKRLNL